MENEEVIRRHMAQTRASLTDKLQTLEDKLMNSVNEATSAVTDTVASVKETMHEGVESVKGAVDVQAHVDRHPWFMLGGSILGGYMLGNLLAAGRVTASERRASRAFPDLPASVENGPPKIETPVRQGITNSLLGAIEPELQRLKGLALGVTLGMVREMLTEEVPAHMAEQLREIIDGVTTKLGGEPIPSSDFGTSKSEQAACNAAKENADFEIDKPRW